jgi:outer membrane protein assembly factor BamD (BamD/ComL family)
LTFLDRYPDAAVSIQALQRLADLDRQANETWEKIKDSADPGIIRAFIKQYPASLVTLIDANQRLMAVEREARKKQAEAAAAQAEWNAINKNDVAAISDIAARFPNAPFAAEAKKRITELQREETVQAEKLADARKAQAETAAAQAEWNAVNKNDSAAISDVVTRFPDAPFAEEAKKRITELQREEKVQADKAAESRKKQAVAVALAEWNAVNRNDAAAISNIVTRFPDAPFAGEAKKRINELQHEEKEKAAAARDWQELKSSRDAAAIRAFIHKYPTTSLALNEAKKHLDALTHAAEASHHQQVASKPAPRPVEPSHRFEPSPRARNFSGVGF